MMSEEDRLLYNEKLNAIPDDVREKMLKGKWDWEVPLPLEETLGEELRDTFALLMLKMEAGKKEYGDSSLKLPITDLLDEVDAELLDQIGWSIIARRKVNVLRGVAKILEQRIKEMQQEAHPVYEIRSHVSEEAMREVGDKLAGRTWQSIETAPKDGSDVLIWAPGFNQRQISFWRDGYWMGCDFKPTHWHPLPDDPPVPE